MSILRNKEFLISKFSVSKDSVTISGRCCDFALKVGDVLTHIYQLDVVDSNDEVREGNLKNIRKVNFEIYGISTYGHSMNELDSGLTGELVLKGNGFEYLAEGYLLGELREIV